MVNRCVANYSQPQHFTNHDFYLQVRQSQVSPIYGVLVLTEKPISVECVTGSGATVVNL